MCLSTWSPANGVSKVVVSIVTKALLAKDWGHVWVFIAQPHFFPEWVWNLTTLLPDCSARSKSAFGLPTHDGLYLSRIVRWDKPSYPLSYFFFRLFYHNRKLTDSCTQALIWSLLTIFLLFYFYIAVDHFNTYVWENLIPNILYGNTFLWSLGNMMPLNRPLLCSLHLVSPTSVNCLYCSGRPQPFNPAA